MLDRGDMEKLIYTTDRFIITISASGQHHNLSITVYITLNDPIIVYDGNGIGGL